VPSVWTWQAPAARHARELLGGDATIVRGDIERLPFADAVFDVIATCWTLYFMPDIDETLGEIKRCVRPGGRLIAATVAADNMHEYQSLIEDAVRDALHREPEPDMGGRFDLLTGCAYMQRHFADVALREWRGTMSLPDADAALTLWRGYGPQLADPREDLAARAAFERLVRARIAREGVFTMTRHSGMFIASS
jgi:SAM-dependent methyltransferase